jgi:hypothetical protein
VVLADPQGVIALSHPRSRSMAYSVPRIAWRLATYILVCPVVRISLGLGSAIFLYFNGSVMAEKLTAIGYRLSSRVCFVSWSRSPVFL